MPAIFSLFVAAGRFIPAAGILGEGPEDQVKYQPY
jgi:hypothetical protein